MIIGRSSGSGIRGLVLNRSTRTKLPSSTMQMFDLNQIRLEKLNRLLESVWERNSFYTCKWRAAGLPQRPIFSLDQLQEFPFTTRDELIADQIATPPLGTNLTFPITDYKRIHRSSGTTRAPIFWADTAASWQWVMQCSQGLFSIAGVKPRDRIFFAMNFGASSGPWIIYEGAHQIGCCCLTAGTAERTIQLDYLKKFNPNILVAKPVALFDLASAAIERGLQPSSLGVEKIISFGKDGCDIASIREHAKNIWRAECFDRYGMTEAGSVAGECEAHSGGMHLLESEFIAEVIDPNTLKPIKDGETGELVLTNFGRISRPIIRYRTGDLVRLVRNHPCSCGRAGARLLGGVTRYRN